MKGRTREAQTSPEYRQRQVCNQATSNRSSVDHPAATPSLFHTQTNQKLYRYYNYTIKHATSNYCKLQEKLIISILVPENLQEVHWYSIMLIRSAWVVQMLKLAGLLVARCMFYRSCNSGFNETTATKRWLYSVDDFQTDKLDRKTIALYTCLLMHELING